MKYDTGDVKSVQKFLTEIKTKFDAVNALLPEGSDAMDYDGFVNSFFKANDGILKNRDALKQEKIEITETYDTFKKEQTEKWGSIDENIQTMYNNVVEERDSLKSVMKDGKVDIDEVNEKHASEMKLLETRLGEQFATDTKELTDGAVTLTSERDAFKDNYFDVLKTNTLSSELDRIKVNPEDRQLIMDANVSRATIAQDDEGKFNVVFKNGDEAVNSDKFWDTWASDENHQKYILSGDNNGGGAGGANNTKPASERAKLQAQADDATLPLHKQLLAIEKLGKLKE